MALRTGQDGLDDEEPPSTDPAPRHNCPRCGGASVPRRMGRRSNPFLYTPLPKTQLTCVDCGLDFDVRPDPAS